VRHSVLQGLFTTIKLNWPELQYWTRVFQRECSHHMIWLSTNRPSFAVANQVETPTRVTNEPVVELGRLTVAGQYSSFQFMCCEQAFMVCSETPQIQVGLTPTVEFCCTTALTGSEVIQGRPVTRDEQIWRNQEKLQRDHRITLSHTANDTTAPEGVEIKRADFQNFPRWS